ncbi:MAG: PAS domain S-box protein [Anaerolineales bacterium]|nr:PAS domain S-box protein [Anaerolineales bacterium]
MPASASQPAQTWLDNLKPADLFHTIFETADLGVILLTADGLIHRANPAFQQMCHQTVDELAGQSFLTLISAHTRPLWVHYWEPIMAGQRPSAQLEIQLILPQDPTPRPLWVSMTLARTNSDPPLMLALVQDITPRKTTEADLRELRHRLGQSREKTQLRLAQDLHDGPMQELYAAQFQLQALARRNGVQTDPAAQEALQTTQAIFQGVNKSLREICGELRPPTLVPFGLATAVRSLAETLQERYPNLTFTLHLDDDGQRLPEPMRLALYRIAQEAVNNVLKHAQATRILINLHLIETNQHTARPSEIVLEVQDNGRGFAVPARWIELARQEHLGLVGAAERAEDINGQFLILSTPGKGTIVRITAPLPPTGENE